MAQQQFSKVLLSRLDRLEDYQREQFSGVRKELVDIRETASSVANRMANVESDNEAIKVTINLVEDRVSALESSHTIDDYNKKRKKKMRKTLKEALMWFAQYVAPSLAGAIAIAVSLL